MVIGLGIRVRDRITGHTGIVTGRSEYLYASPQCLVAHETDHEKAKWFDEARLEDAPASHPVGFTKVESRGV